MKCPACHSDNFKCTDSRPAKHLIRRRRECFDCSKRWSTVEINEDEFKALRNLTLVPARVFIGDIEVSIGLKRGQTDEI